MIKKTLKIIIGILVILIFGGIGGVFFGKYLFPELGKNSFFGKYQLFQQMEKNTTIIRKTETIVTNNDNQISEISSNISSSVVDIFSFYNNSKKSKKEKIKKHKKGTGVVLTNDGLIVTYKDNVLLGNDIDYEVMIFDGSLHKATFLGIDNFANLAYFQVKDVNLPAIPFANSNDVELGKKVIVIGHSKSGPGISLQNGILSDFERSFNLSGKTVASSEKLEGVFKVSFFNEIQYVGGPVINYNGEMIAITGMETINNKNIYFQIPANVIKNSMNKIFNFDKSAQLGIYYLSINKFYQKIHRLSVDKGALIYSPSGEQGLAIIHGSSAEKAGLKINDIVISVNNEEIDWEHPLSNYISKYSKGEEILLGILRNGKKMSIKVNL